MSKKVSTALVEVDDANSQKSSVLEAMIRIDPRRAMDSGAG